MLSGGLRFTAAALLAVVMAAAVPASANITVGAGSSWTAADAHYHLGCGDISNQGDLDLGTSTFAAVRNFSNGSNLVATAADVSVGGDWSNTGTVNAGSSVFRFADECGDGSSTITGETTFPTLSVTSGLGKTVYFAANATQTVTDSLILEGIAGMLLVLRSTEAGTQAAINLVPGGSQYIRYVDVADHLAAGAYLAPGPPSQFDSVDSGNNTRWFLGLTAPAPALSLPALALACAALLFLAWTRQRGRMPGLSKHS